MNCGFAEQSLQFWFGSGIQQAEPNVLGSEARGTDQRSFAIAILIKVEIRASLNERFDKLAVPCLFAECQRTACPRCSGADV